MVERLTISRAVVEKIKADMEYICMREDYTFAECIEAETICDKARSALEALNESMAVKEMAVGEDNLSRGKPDNGNVPDNNASRVSVQAMKGAEMNPPEYWENEIAERALSSRLGSIDYNALINIIRECQADAIACNPEPRNGWQPIETAPKDGTRVDLWVSHPDRKQKSYRATYCRYDEEEQVWMKDGAPIEGFLQKGGTYLIHPTHWQPLPSGPDGEGAGS